MDNVSIMDESLIDRADVMKEEVEFYNQISGDEETVEDISEDMINPLLQRPVIMCVLKYMNLQDVKTCRLISQGWNSAAQLVLRDLSKIKLLTSEMDPFTDERRFHPSKYLEEFSSTLENMPFTAFRISTFAKSSCHIDNFSEFFEKHQKNIRELEITKVCEEESTQNNDFDITKWLSNSPKAKSKNKFHTKLKIDANFNFQVMLRSRVLVNVKELSLSGDGCGVVLENNILIHPIKLTLSNVSFITQDENGDGYTSVQDFCVNDIVDFSRAKYIDLLNHYGTELCLDLSKNGKLNLDYLRLDNISIDNWSNCNWEVEKMELEDVPLEEPTEMKIHELKYLQGVLDLCALPKSLKNLTIDFAKYRYIEDDLYVCVVCCSIDQPLFFNNLRCLTLKFLEFDCFATFFIYAKCPNLVDLHVEEDSTDLCEINSDWFPKTLKRLKLSGVKINWIEGAENFNIDKLVLTDYPSFVLEEFCKKIKAKEIIIPFLDFPTCYSMCPMFNEDFNPEYIDNYLYELCHSLCLLSLRNFYETGQCVYAGPFKWKDWGPFENSPMVFLVDKESKYYVFENQAWKPLDISDDEFEQKSTFQ